MKWPLCAAVVAYAMGNAPANAHSASDAYLNLTVESQGQGGPFLVHGQWDIALRDLDFVLKLDDDGDGRLTWGEFRHHQADITRYAYNFIRIDGDAGTHCSIKPVREMIDDHADGAYAALFFDLVCPRRPEKITLNYSMFFAVDPSHRGIFVMTNRTNSATAVLSPDKHVIDLKL